MAVVEGKRVWAWETTTDYQGEEVDAWAARCPVAGCGFENVGRVIYAGEKGEDHPKNKISFEFDEPWRTTPMTCDHLMPHEASSINNWLGDGMFEFGIVLDTDERFEED